MSHRCQVTNPPNPVDVYGMNTGELGTGDVVLHPVADMHGTMGSDAQLIKGVREDPGIGLSSTDDGAHADDVESISDSQLRQNGEEARVPVADDSQPVSGV